MIEIASIHLDSVTMARPTLASVLQNYLRGRTYDEWAEISGISRGAINNAAIGKVPRPHPDTLEGIAKALGKQGKGDTEEIYLELMGAAGYFDLVVEAEKNIVDEITKDYGVLSKEENVIVWLKHLRDTDPEEFQALMLSLGDDNSKPSGANT